MQTNNRPPLYVIVACILSAIACGFLCWNFTLRSDAEPTTRDYLFLLVYLCLSLMSYLGGLGLLARLSHFRGTEVIVVLFLISVAGTTVPYVASSVQIWATHSLELASFLRQSAVAWVLYNGGMLGFMTVVATVAFIVTLPFRPATRNVAGV
jgi:hypothetical protein